MPSLFINIRDQSKPERRREDKIDVTYIENVSKTRSECRGNNLFYIETQYTVVEFGRFSDNAVLFQMSPRFSLQ